MIVRRAVVCSVVALIVSSLSACSDPVADAAAAPPAARVALSVGNVGHEFPTYADASHEVSEGARLFGYQRCAECHSDAGVILGAGNGNVDTIATAIRDGRPGMPRYGGKLTDAQIWQLAAFVKALAAAPDGATVRTGVDLTLAP